jgi:hypothetical protein
VDWYRLFASASALQPFQEGAEASFLTGGLLEQPFDMLLASPLSPLPRVRPLRNSAILIFCSLLRFAACAFMLPVLIVS